MKNRNIGRGIASFGVMMAVSAIGWNSPGAGVVALVLGLFFLSEDVWDN